MPIELIAECATGHGGDVGRAEAMIAAAAKAGAHAVKFQSYSLETLNPADPQADWLKHAWLSPEAHEVLKHCCYDHGVQFLSTPCDAKSLEMLRGLGCIRFKIASSQSGQDWWIPQDHESWLVSIPWGVNPWRPVSTVARDAHTPLLNLTAIPLYPTPLECVGRATILDGWSDHGAGLAGCQYVLAHGAKVIEVHFTIPGARHMPWDKTPEQLRDLRAFADAMDTIQTGVSQTFRERWRA